MHYDPLINTLQYMLPTTTTFNNKLLCYNSRKCFGRHNNKSSCSFEAIANNALKSTVVVLLLCDKKGSLETGGAGRKQPAWLATEDTIKLLKGLTPQRTLHWHASWEIWSQLANTCSALIKMCLQWWNLISLLYMQINMHDISGCKHQMWCCFLNSKSSSWT